MNVRKPVGSLIGISALYGLVFTFGIGISGCGEKTPSITQNNAQNSAPSPDNNATDNNATDNNATFAAPIAAFEASTLTAKAGEIIRFDASATVSSSKKLVYSWDFGNGKLGGSARIAQLFPVGGSFDITLTVTDELGQTDRITQTVQIENVDFPSGDYSHQITVLDVDNQPLNDVIIKIPHTDISVSTNAQGEAIINGLAPDHDFAIAVHKEGFASQYSRAKTALDTNLSKQTVRMLPVADRITVPNIENGGIVKSKDGARIEFPPNSVVDSQGNAVSGDIEVSVTLFDASSKAHLLAFPTYEAINADGERAMLVTHGAMDVTLSQGEERLQIAPGQAAEIDIPIYTDGAMASHNIDLWSLDETTGVWIQEGNGTVVESPDSPTGVALNGLATHFSLWNADTWVSTPCELQIQFTCTDLNDEEVPLIDESKLEGLVTVEVDPMPGYGKPCTPLGMERKSTSRRAPDPSVPQASNHDPYLLEGQSCFGGHDCMDKNGVVPPDVICKAKRFYTNCNTQPGATAPYVGVCTKNDSDHCPGDFLYCAPDSDPNNILGGRCTAPFYRYSKMAYYRMGGGHKDWICHDDPNEYLRDDDAQVIHENFIPYFQNWNGFTREVPISSNGMAILHQIPRTYFSLSRSQIITSDMEYEPEDYSGEFTQADGTLLPQPGGPAGSAGQRMQDMPSIQCFAGEDGAGPEVLKWNVGACDECEPTPCCGDECNDIPEHCREEEPMVPCCDAECADVREACRQPSCTDILIKCDHPPYGVNDVYEHCEIDALMVERGLDYLPVKSVTITSDNQAIPDGLTEAERIDRLLEVDFNECHPDSWGDYVVYFKNYMKVEFDEPLKDDDVLRIYRQGVPAHHANSDGDRCQASGLLSVIIPDPDDNAPAGSGRTIDSGRWNSFDLRLTKELLTGGN